MNLSPDPQLVTSSSMDYDALLLKETKTNNDNVYLKSRFEELKETHQNLISQLENHKIIKAEEWFETGDISDSLKKYEYLKEENATLKEVQKTNQKIREEYEKEMRDIKIAMGCEGPLSWDITDILNWIEMKEEQLEATHNCSQQANADYERLVDKNNNDNLNFGDILSERDAEIEELKDKVDTHKKASIYEHTSCYDGRMMLVKTLWEKEEDWRERIDLDFPHINKEIEDLKKKVANNKRFTDNAVTTLLHNGWTKGDCGVWCEPKSQPRDEEDNDGYRKEVAKLKEENEELKEEAVENKKLFDITFSEVMKHKEEATTWENIARGKSSALKKHLPDYNPKFWTGSDESNIDYCFDKINDEISNLKSDNNNLMCVINHLKIDYKKVLKEIEADCSPDAWDSM